MKKKIIGIALLLSCMFLAGCGCGQSNDLSSTEETIATRPTDLSKDETAKFYIDALMAEDYDTALLAINVDDITFLTGEDLKEALEGSSMAALLNKQEYVLEPVTSDEDSIIYSIVLADQELKLRLIKNADGDYRVVTPVFYTKDAKISISKNMPLYLNGVLVTEEYLTTITEGEPDKFFDHYVISYVPAKAVTLTSQNEISNFECEIIPHAEEESRFLCQLTKEETETLLEETRTLLNQINLQYESEKKEPKVENYEQYVTSENDQFTAENLLEALADGHTTIKGTNVKQEIISLDIKDAEEFQYAFMYGSNDIIGLNFVYQKTATWEANTKVGDAGSKNSKNLSYIVLQKIEDRYVIYDLPMVTNSVLGWEPLLSIDWLTTDATNIGNEGTETAEK